MSCTRSWEAEDAVVPVAVSSRSSSENSLNSTIAEWPGTILPAACAYIHLHRDSTIHSISQQSGRPS